MIRELLILAASGGGEGFTPIVFRPDALVLTWITFLVTLVILTKFCWRPILNSAREREERIANDIKSAQSARTEAEEMLQRYQSQLENARQEVSQLIDEGRTSAEKLKKEILEKANQESEAARNRANKEIELARDQALEQIRTEAIDLSITVASRILERSLDDDDHRKLAKDILEKV
ncbi:MAG: F0F1 ATP synthase subunit B [Planctomycetota bacterium]|jgi:F-type H+-transporting ATPase subunit b